MYNVSALNNLNTRNIKCYFTGNTWLQDMTWLIMNNGDTEGATAEAIMDRVPLIEAAPGGRVLVDIVASREPPRLINSHLAFHLLKKPVETANPKTIIVFRNPKDVSVSYYHFYNTRPGRKNCFPEFGLFFEQFMTGNLLFGSWFDYTRGWMDYAKVNPNTTLVLTYEDIKADHQGTIKKVAKFLGKNISKDMVEKIREFTSFDTMKARAEVIGVGTDKGSDNKTQESPFFRKGVVGDWKNTMTVAQSEFIDAEFKQKLGHVHLNFCAL